MIDKIDELFIQLNNKDELKKIPSLLILNLPGETDLKKGKLENPIILMSFMYLQQTTLVSNGYLEIKVNTVFDIIFTKKEPESFLELNQIEWGENVQHKNHYRNPFTLGFKRGVTIE